MKKALRVCVAAGLAAAVAFTPTIAGAQLDSIFNQARRAAQQQQAQQNPPQQSAPASTAANGESCSINWGNIAAASAPSIVAEGLCRFNRRACQRDEVRIARVLLAGIAVVATAREVTNRMSCQEQQRRADAINRVSQNEPGSTPETYEMDNGSTAQVRPLSSITRGQDQCNVYEETIPMPDGTVVQDTWGSCVTPDGQTYAWEPN